MDRHIDPDQTVGLRCAGQQTDRPVVEVRDDRAEMQLGRRLPIVKIESGFLALREMYPRGT